MAKVLFMLASWSSKSLGDDDHEVDDDDAGWPCGLQEPLVMVIVMVMLDRCDHDNYD